MGEAGVARVPRATSCSRSWPATSTLYAQQAELMAGIGWKLERCSIATRWARAMGVFLTGAAVTSGPWLLTTAGAGADASAPPARRGTVGVDGAERVITLVYAT